MLNFADNYYCLQIVYEFLCNGFVTCLVTDQYLLAISHLIFILYSRNFSLNYCRERLFFFVGKIRLHFLHVFLDCQVESRFLYTCKLEILFALVQFGSIVKTIYLSMQERARKFLNCEGLDLLFVLQLLESSNACTGEQSLLSCLLTFLLCSQG